MITSQSRLNNLSRVQAGVSSPLVLAIDDQEDSLFLLSCVLESFSCKFVGKATAEAALEFVKLHQPSLILLDLLLPDMHGAELVTLLRQQQNLSNVPIIATTGLAIFGDREQLLAAGFSDYLGKPYLLEELEILVQRWGIPNWKAS